MRDELGLRKGIELLEQDRLRQGWLTTRFAATSIIGWLLALLLVVLLGLLSSACGVGRPGEPVSVILITIDTIRADHLGCYGYFRDTTPSIDALAADSVLFEQAVSVSGTTLPAHVSLMTSTYPSRHRVFSNHYRFRAGERDPLRTMAQMFRRAGYATAAFASSGGWTEETGMHVGFDTFRFPEGKLWQIAEKTTDQVGTWLEQRPAEPIFLWVHYFDPHLTYAAPPPFKGMYQDEPELRQYIRETEVPSRQRLNAVEHNNRYDGEIRYMDSQLGEFLQALRSAGLYDDSLIILAGDHGEGMMQHHVLRHGVIHNEQLRVPLLLKFPRGTGPPPGRYGDLVSLIDVLPTVAAQLALPLPVEQFDGVDVFSEERRSALAEREHTRRFDELSTALVTENWKYVHYASSDDELFDLTKDPWETRNVIDAHPRVAETMQSKLRTLLQENRERSGRVDRGPEASKELADELRKLGYVE